MARAALPHRDGYVRPAGRRRDGSPRRTSRRPPGRGWRGRRPRRAPPRFGSRRPQCRGCARRARWSARRPAARRARRRGHVRPPPAAELAAQSSSPAAPRGRPPRRVRAPRGAPYVVAGLDLASAARSRRSPRRSGWAPGRRSAARTRCRWRLPGAGADRPRPSKDASPLSGRTRPPRTDGKAVILPEPCRSGHRQHASGGVLDGHVRERGPWGPETPSARRPPFTMRPDLAGAGRGCPATVADRGDRS